MWEMKPEIVTQLGSQQIQEDAKSGKDIFTLIKTNVLHALVQMQVLGPIGRKFLAAYSNFFTLLLLKLLPFGLEGGGNDG